MLPPLLLPLAGRGQEEKLDCSIARQQSGVLCNAPRIQTPESVVLQHNACLYWQPDQRPTEVTTARNTRSLEQRCHDSVTLTREHAVCLKTRCCVDRQVCVCVCVCVLHT